MIIEQQLEVSESILVNSHEESIREDYVEFIPTKKLDLLFTTVDNKNIEFPIQLCFLTAPLDLLYKYNTGQKFNVKIEITPVEEEINNNIILKCQLR